MHRSEIVQAFWGDLPANERSMLLDDRHALLSEGEREQILACLPNLSGKTLLELGAGIGRFTRELAPRAERVVAVDLMEHFVAANRAENGRFGNVDFVCADAMKLDYPPAAFDFVFINWLLMYLNDDEVAVFAARLREWVKPGGHFFLRESCSAKGEHLDVLYYVHYRTLEAYDALFAEGFCVQARDNIKSYSIHAGNPYQRYWLFQRT